MFGMCLPAPVISHPASPLAIGHAICLCSRLLNYVFPFFIYMIKEKDQKKKTEAGMRRPWKRNNNPPPSSSTMHPPPTNPPTHPLQAAAAAPTTLRVPVKLLSNCCRGYRGEPISAFLPPPAAVHKARGCHTHSVCST